MSISRYVSVRGWITLVWAAACFAVWTYTVREVMHETERFMRDPMTIEVVRR